MCNAFLNILKNKSEETDTTEGNEMKGLLVDHKFIDENNQLLSLKSKLLTYNGHSRRGSKHSD